MTHMTEMALSLQQNPPADVRVGAARDTTRAEIFAKILQTCPGVRHGSTIAIVGRNASDYQVALSARGFTRAAAIPTAARLAHDVRHCICLMDGAVDGWAGVDALASLKRCLAPAGTLVLDMSHDHALGQELENRLALAGFRAVQYRVLALPTRGEHNRAVLLVAQTPRSRVVDLSADSRRAAA